MESLVKSLLLSNDGFSYDDGSGYGSGYGSGFGAGDGEGYGDGSGE